MQIYICKTQKVPKSESVRKLLKFINCQRIALVLRQTQNKMSEHISLWLVSLFDFCVVSSFSWRHYSWIMRTNWQEEKLDFHWRRLETDNSQSRFYNMIKHNFWLNGCWQQSWQCVSEPTGLSRHVNSLLSLFCISRGQRADLLVPLTVGMQQCFIQFKTTHTETWQHFLSVFLFSSWTFSRSSSVSARSYKALKLSWQTLQYMLSSEHLTACYRMLKNKWIHKSEKVCPVWKM